MERLNSISITDAKVPKYFRKMAKLILKLWAEQKLDKLREIRDSGTNIKLRIYHHSAGTDGYFCDVKARYFNWQQVEDFVNEKTKKGEYTMTIVMPYKANVFFTRGIKNQIKNN